jgi:hypothetical protein
MRGEEGAQLLHVGLPGFGVGATKAQELEELLRGPRDEGGVGGPENVGLVSARGTELYCHPARFSPRIV